MAPAVPRLRILSGALYPPSQNDGLRAYFLFLHRLGRLAWDGCVHIPCCTALALAVPCLTLAAASAYVNLC